MPLTFVSMAFGNGPGTGRRAGGSHLAGGINRVFLTPSRSETRNHEDEYGEWKWLGSHCKSPRTRRGLSAGWQTYLTARMPDRSFALSGKSLYHDRLEMLRAPRRSSSGSRRATDTIRHSRTRLPMRMVFRFCGPRSSGRKVGLFLHADGGRIPPTRRLEPKLY